MNKICEFCNNEISLGIKNYKQAKYCSKDCLSKSRDLRRNRPPKHDRNCLVCNSLISHKERRDKVYCSTICKQKDSQLKAEALVLNLEDYKHLITNRTGETSINLEGTKSIGETTLIDTKYLELVNHISKKWYLTPQGYARTSRDIRLHRVIAELKFGKLPNDKVVDHINRNKLDNRESNIRLATTAGNSSNRDILPNASSFKGVYKNKEKFIAQICVNNKVKHLGRFCTPEEAAKAYNEAAFLHQGEFAVFNILT